MRMDWTRAVWKGLPAVAEESKESSQLAGAVAARSEKAQPRPVEEWAQKAAASAASAREAGHSASAA